MGELYNDAHAIILTSAFEGFPVVIKEGMAHSCIPVVTALPGNKIHLKHLSNALLIEEPDNEDAVIRNGIGNIQLLINDPAIVKKLSASAYEYAKNNFNKHNFLKAYNALLTSAPHT
jgi:glycosyltransferase involved in cell wall biosynthesis